MPTAARVAVLVNPTNAANTATTLKDVTAAASTIGLQIKVLNASTSREISAAFATFVSERPDALFVAGDRSAERLAVGARRLPLAVVGDDADAVEEREEAIVITPPARR